MLAKVANVAARAARALGLDPEVAPTAPASAAISKVSALTLPSVTHGSAATASVVALPSASAALPSSSAAEAEEVDPGDHHCSVCMRLSVPATVLSDLPPAFAQFADDQLICEGGCRRCYHLPCMGLSVEALAALKASEAPWMCDDCTRRDHCCFLCGQRGDRLYRPLRIARGGLMLADEPVLAAAIPTAPAASSPPPSKRAKKEKGSSSSSGDSIADSAQSSSAPSGETAGAPSSSSSSSSASAPEASDALTRALLAAKVLPASIVPGAVAAADEDEGGAADGAGTGKKAVRKRADKQSRLARQLGWSAEFGFTTATEEQEKARKLKEAAMARAGETGDYNEDIDDDASDGGFEEPPPAAYAPPAYPGAPPQLLGLQWSGVKRCAHKKCGHWFHYSCLRELNDAAVCDAFIRLAKLNEVTPPLFVRSEARDTDSTAAASTATGVSKGRRGRPPKSAASAAVAVASAPASAPAAAVEGGAAEESGAASETATTSGGGAGSGAGRKRQRSQSQPQSSTATSSSDAAASASKAADEVAASDGRRKRVKTAKAAALEEEQLSDEEIEIKKKRKTKAKVGAVTASGSSKRGKDGKERASAGPRKAAASSSSAAAAATAAAAAIPGAFDPSSHPLLPAEPIWLCPGATSDFLCPAHTCDTCETGLQGVKAVVMSAPYQAVLAAAASAAAARSKSSPPPTASALAAQLSATLPSHFGDMTVQSYGSSTPRYSADQLLNLLHRLQAAVSAAAPAPSPTTSSAAKEPATTAVPAKASGHKRGRPRSASASASAAEAETAGQAGADVMSASARQDSTTSFIPAGAAAALAAVTSPLQAVHFCLRYPEAALMLLGPSRPGDACIRPHEQLFIVSAHCARSVKRLIGRTLPRVCLWCPRSYHAVVRTSRKAGDVPSKCCPPATKATGYCFACASHSHLYVPGEKGQDDQGLALPPEALRAASGGTGGDADGGDEAEDEDGFAEDGDSDRQVKLPQSLSKLSSAELAGVGKNAGSALRSLFIQKGKISIADAADPRHFRCFSSWIDATAEDRSSAKPPPYIRISRNVYVSKVEPIVDESGPCTCAQLLRAAKTGGGAGGAGAGAGAGGKKHNSDSNTVPLPGNPICGDDCLNRQLRIECEGNCMPSAEGSAEGGAGAGAGAGAAPARAGKTNCSIGLGCGNRAMSGRQSSNANIKIAATEGKGFGLIATAAIPARSFIIEYVGEVIDEEEQDRRLAAAEAAGDSHFFLMEIDANQIIDARFKGNAARFINHSCDPNAELQRWQVKGYTRIGIFALRDIAAGEEITYDYQFFTAEETACRCGTAKCRGYLGANVAEDKAREAEEEKERLKEERRQARLARKLLRSTE